MSKNFIVEKYELDDNQMQLLLNDTNSIVIAGAGSGKTLTILGKVNYLIDVYILKINNFNYNLCNTNLLKYIIIEYLNTSSKDEQKTILKFLKINTSYHYFLSSLYFKNFCNLIITFINFYKTNNYNFKNINLKKYSQIEKKILLIIFKIYNIYIQEKQSNNKLDFDDLIIYATNYSKTKRLNYKYIIIDEFQDTSLLRLNLIKSIYLNEHSKVIVVGDDWQSIYHFSGCDLNIFLNFSDFFPYVQEFKLINTYRNSQELIDIAAQFIQKNPTQIRKKLLSCKTNKMPIILVPYLNKKQSFKILLNNLLDKTDDIMILSRNSNDIYDYLDNDMNLKNDYIEYKNFTIKFLTVHKSKGLEAKFTIILNCNNDILGFPNKIENNKILGKLFPNEKMPFAEERRLFYVALTRCKETTYIMYNKNNPSIFIKELKRIIKCNFKQINYFKV